MSGQVESGVLDKGDHFRDMLLNVTHITLRARTIRVVIKSCRKVSSPSISIFFI